MSARIRHSIQSAGTKALPVIMVFVLAACATDGATSVPTLSQTQAAARTQDGGKQAASATMAGVPADYRVRTAQIIRSGTRFPIRDAHISTLRMLWAGIQWGGDLPGVCVHVFRENPFGYVVRDTWQVTFKNGAIAGAGYAHILCEEGMSKFPELLAK